MPFTHTLSEDRMTTSRRTWIYALTLGGFAAAALGPAALASAKDTTDMKATATAGDKAEHGDKVNINTADVKELMKLQGVGRSLAEKIVQYRDAHGPFKKAGDFRKVDGVGDGVWEKNRERIVVK